jgi:hypothetical protein
VWFSRRLVRNHLDIIGVFSEWLREQAEVVSVDDDTVGVVQGHCCIERDLASIRWGSSPGR